MPDTGDPREIAAALSNLATTVSLDGDHLEARALLEEARHTFEQLSDDMGAAWSLNHLGDVAHRQGLADEVERLYQQAVAEFSRLGDAWGLARSSADLGYLVCEIGRRIARERCSSGPCVSSSAWATSAVSRACSRDTHVWRSCSVITRGRWCW